MTSLSYSGYRFPREIIQRAVWIYLGFTLSLRAVEDLLAERRTGVTTRISGAGCSPSAR
jgi:putative transposase